DPFAYSFRSVPAYEPIDIDLTEGNNKIFIKMKTTVPGTIIRFDVQDLDNFITTATPVQKVLTEEFAVYEFDFGGLYSDGGFGGTACTMETAPCPVDPTRITGLVFFVEPGVGQFAGDIVIDYISVGTSLEPGGSEPELVYEDRFNNETLEYTTPGEGYSADETGSDLIVTGDGSAPPFSAVSYILHDKETGLPDTIDITPAQSRLFVKMRTSNTDHAVRIDIIDSTGLISNATAVTKVVGNEFTVLEYSFDGLVADGGFGGSPCTMETAPCLLDPTAITQLLFYIDAADGGFEGDLIIDYVAFGQELGDDPIITPTGVVNHTDQFNDQSGLFLGTTGGITNGFMDGAITLTGDGTSGAFAAIPYDLHDETGTLLIADAAVTGDSLFIRARSTTAVDLRIDLEDNQGFATTNAGITNSLSSDYQVLSYVYTNSYTDGGFGGTSCTMETAPCAVDAQRIAKLVFYPAPNVGAYDDTIDIDWISFGRS
ncbi:MAG: hypothetical protein AAFU67_16105, partial [Bacteroidota bacterium]